MKNPFERLWKSQTTKRPAHPYRDAPSDEEMMSMKKHEAASNAAKFKKIIRTLDRFILTPDRETVLAIQALGARLLDEPLPAGSPSESVLDNWLAQLDPHQRHYVIHNVTGSPEGVVEKIIEWNKQKHQPVCDRIMKEIEIEDKRRRR